MQNEQVDKVSSRMAEKIQPILAELRMAWFGLS